MRVAVARHPDVSGNAHFGFAGHFDVFDLGDGPPRLVGTRRTTPHCGDDGGDRGRLADSVELLADCAVAVAAAIGPCARRELALRGIVAVEHPGPGLAGAQSALQAFRARSDGRHTKETPR